jgi:hypothetical protein
VSASSTLFVDDSVTPLTYNTYEVNLRDAETGTPVVITAAWQSQMHFTHIKTHDGIYAIAYGAGYDGAGVKAQVKRIPDNVKAYIDPEIPGTTIPAPGTTWAWAVSAIYDDINKALDKDSISFSGTLKTSDEGAEMKISNGYIKPNRKKYFTEQITFAKKALETITAEKNQSEIIRKAQAGIDLYNLIKNETFEIHTPAEQLKDDEVTLTPKLIFSDGKTGYEFKPVSIKTYGGLPSQTGPGKEIKFIVE